MKEIIEFLTWQWNKWQAWQRVYVISMLAVVSGFVLPGIIGALLLVVGISSLMSWLFKWAIWDSVSTAYEDFKREKTNEQNKNS